MPAPFHRAPPFPRVAVLALCAAALLAGSPGFAQTPPPAPAPAPTAVVVEVPDAETLHGFAWNWVEGDVARYRMVTDTEATVAAAMFPEPMTTQVQQVVELTHEVVAVSPEGVGTVRVTYDSLEMTGEIPGQGTIDWSSKDPEVEGSEQMASAMTGVWGLLIGKPVTLQIDRRGTVLAIAGLEEVMQQVIAGVGHDEASAAAMRPMMEEFLSEENLQQMTQQGLLVFPDEELTVGDAWTNELDLKMPIIGALRQRQTYTFERFDGPDAVLLLDGTIAVGAEGGMAGMPAELGEMMDITFATKTGEVEGSLRFDRERGLLAHQETTLRLEMTVTLTPKGEMAKTVDEPMVMEITTSATTDYELLPPK